MDKEMEQWLAEMWEERKAHQRELRSLLRKMGSTLNITRTEEDKKREYEMWRMRMINNWEFGQLPEKERMQIIEEHIKRNKERRARKNAIRDN